MVPVRRKSNAMVRSFFNKLFLDISLMSLRASEKSMPFYYSRSPPAEWTFQYSYILSSDDDDTPKRAKKDDNTPSSVNKSVGTSGTRKSKRLLEKELNQTKTGK